MGVVYNGDLQIMREQMPIAAQVFSDWVEVQKKLHFQITEQQIAKFLDIIPNYKIREILLRHHIIL